MVDTNRQSKQDYLWNTAAGLINAAEAVIMSMIVTRVTGLADAGMLTIAFAIGNLMMPIGKFGIRNYQVTDIENKFSFAIYFKTRMITVLLMLLSTAGYLVYAYEKLQYSSDKIGIILAICMIYVVETVEDVLWGYYQRRHRLDAGAKMFCFRWMGILVVFPIALCITGSLSITLGICFIVSVILFIVLVRIFHPQISSAEDKNLTWRLKKDDFPVIWQLLKIAFPLFGIAFLSFYVNNAPKYAIDAWLTEEMQACYGFVAMPVFVIGLLNNFVYQPTLVPMAAEWEQREQSKFRKRITRQLVVILIITVICLAGAYLLGIPVLSWLYNTDLSGFKAELLILLVAGGFLAMSGYLSVVLTIMRYQKDLLWPYCLIAVIALIGLNQIVSRYATMGAAVCYMALMMLLCFIYGVILVVRLKGTKE
ncbi:MAG: lipopolysaccharide biosynthesis protein [Lachnospiraceae bacterium]|nr:lipopolysaccharide biosynthesis protein [Lachnospiraceae bacterium]